MPKRRYPTQSPASPAGTGKPASAAKKKKGKAKDSSHEPSAPLIPCLPITPPSPSMPVPWQEKQLKLMYEHQQEAVCLDLVHRDLKNAHEVEKLRRAESERRMKEEQHQMEIIKQETGRQILLGEHRDKLEGNRHSRFLSMFRLVFYPLLMAVLGFTISWFDFGGMGKHFPALRRWILSFGTTQESLPNVPPPLIKPPARFHGEKSPKAASMPVDPAVNGGMTQ